MPTNVPPPIVRIDERRPGTRAGYVATAVVDAVLIWVFHNLLDWGWPPFLTEDLESLLPLITVSLAATIVVNLVWIAYDPGWFKSLTQIGLNAISLAVAVRTWQVFPFDFSPYEFDWGTVARVVLIVAIVGIIAATVVDLVKVTTAATDTAQREAQHRA
jgi:hypothetical protein